MSPRLAGKQDGFLAAMRESLWRQAGFLSNHIEWDLRGNHLVRDALGLACAARFLPDAPDARTWLGQAAEIAESQVR